MNVLKKQFRLSAIAASTLAIALLSGPVFAHCDSMDGPVVADAQRALAEKKVEPVLKWISAGDEPAIKEAFDMTLAVRNESDKAKAVADRYFFETLVRVHRATEGEGFTGLKPAGSVEPGIAAADQALQSGKVEILAGKLADAVRDGVMQRFQTAYKTKQSADDSVKQGREYVVNYVQFTHFIEEIDHVLSKGASHQHREASEQRPH